MRKVNGISQDEANRVLGDLESIKRDKMSCNYLWPIIALAVLSLILIGLCLIMIFTDDTAYYLGWIMLGVFLVGAAIICFLTYKRNMAHEKRMDQRDQDFKSILELHNRREFLARGIEWKSGPMGAWVEANQVQQSPYASVVQAPVAQSVVVQQDPTMIVQSPPRAIRYEPNQPARIVQNSNFVTKEGNNYTYDRV